MSHPLLIERSALSALTGWRGFFFGVFLGRGAGISIKGDTMIELILGVLTPHRVAYVAIAAIYLYLAWVSR
jgi:hypothetical protein